MKICGEMNLVTMFTRAAGGVNDRLQRLHRGGNPKLFVFYLQIRLADVLLQMFYFILFVGHHNIPAYI